METRELQVQCGPHASLFALAQKDCCSMPAPALENVLLDAKVGGTLVLMAENAAEQKPSCLGFCFVIEGLLL